MQAGTVKIMKQHGKSIDIQWLGQAGFLLTMPGGRRIAIDPYLGDSCQRIVGFKRMTPAPLALESFAADYLFLSHEHPDHFDIDLINATRQSSVRIFGSKGCEQRWRSEGLGRDGLSVVSLGESLAFEGFTAHVLSADHGEQCPDALGFVFDFDFAKVYFAGDTSYSPNLLVRAIELRPEIALLPINGMYGNLDERQAARLAQDIGCKVVIPCHYWTFVEHGSNPLAFYHVMKNELPGVKTVFLASGEHYQYEMTESE